MACTVKAFLNVRVPMRDGTELATHVYMPDSGGPFPVFFVRTPYDAIAKGQGALEWPGRGMPMWGRTSAAFPERRRVLSLPPRREGRRGCPDLDCRPALVRREHRHVWRLVSGRDAARRGHDGPSGPEMLHPLPYRLEPYHASYWGGAFRLKGRKEGCFAIHPDLPIVDREAGYIRDALQHPYYDDFWKSFSMSQRSAKSGPPHSFARVGSICFFVMRSIFTMGCAGAAAQKKAEHTRASSSVRGRTTSTSGKSARWTSGRRPPSPTCMSRKSLS